MMSNNMKVEYKGFILKLGTVENYFGDKIQGGYCKELNYKTFNNGNIEKDIANFKNYIDNHPIPQHKLKEKEMTEDKEVQLVNQFISDLNQVLDEMEVVEKNVYYEVVLEAKLMKLMKAYGDSLCLGNSINVYRSHYNYVVKQREEEKDEFEYKGFILKFKVVANVYGNESLGGYCEELNYKTYNKGNKKKDIANFKNFIDNHPTPQHKLKEKELNNSKLHLSFLTTNGQILSLPCHIQEDGTIITEPFTEENTIVGWRLKKD